MGERHVRIEISISLCALLSFYALRSIRANHCGIPVFAVSLRQLFFFAKFVRILRKDFRAAASAKIHGHAPKSAL